jgi:hypothetical protein
LLHNWGIIINTKSHTKVQLGDRVYRGISWSRIDTIFWFDKPIGFIRLSDQNRQGTTISLTSGKEKKGRQIDWCVTQSMALIFGANDQSIIDQIKTSA